MVKEEPQTLRATHIKGKEKDEQKGVIFKSGFFGCYFLAGRRPSSLVSGHQRYWGCCSAFASLSPTSQPDTTETITLLIPNSSSTSLSQGPGSHRLPQELTAPRPKLQMQLAAGWDQEFPTPGLPEGEKTRGVRPPSTAAAPAQAQGSRERSEGTRQRRCLDEACTSDDTRKSTNQPLDVNSPWGS